VRMPRHSGQSATISEGLISERVQVSGDASRPPHDGSENGSVSCDANVAFPLGCRDDRPWHSGHLEAAGDVLGDVTETVAQPAQGLQDLRLPVHGVRGEALTTAVQDELLEVGPAKVRRGVDPLGCAPVGEPSCAVVVPLDGLAAEVPGLAVRQELLPQIPSVMGFLAIGCPTGRTMPLPPLLREDGAEDLSGAPASGRKTCPAAGGANTERLVW
jgi:hypothetical protein